jgi:YggT family protein
MNAFISAGIYLVGLVFDLYIIILLLRLLMQRLGASYYNPISQTIIKLTNVFVVPLRRILPGYHGFDFAIVFLLLVIALIETLLLIWLRTRIVPHFAGTLIIAIIALSEKTINLYFYAIIIRAFMSWVPSLQHNPVAEIVFLVTEPLLRSARRIVPMIAGLDFSPILVLVVLQLISILVIGPLMNMGMRLALM